MVITLANTQLGAEGGGREGGREGGKRGRETERGRGEREGDGEGDGEGEREGVGESYICTCTSTGLPGTSNQDIKVPQVGVKHVRHVMSPHYNSPTCHVKHHIHQPVILPP